MSAEPILFVGATSQVGRAAIPLLRQRGRAVRAFTRDPARAAPLRDLGAEVVQGDLRDPASVRRGCERAAHVVAAATFMDPDFIVSVSERASGVLVPRMPAHILGLRVARSEPPAP